MFIQCNNVYHVLDVWENSWLFSLAFPENSDGNETVDCHLPVDSETETRPQVSLETGTSCSQTLSCSRMKVKHIWNHTSKSLECCSVTVCHQFHSLT